MRHGRQVKFVARLFGIAAWLYDVLCNTKAQVVVCDPRKNRLLWDGNKSDRVDARKLAQLLRAGLLSAVYHGEHGTRDLKELVRSYDYPVEDSTRTMNRIKALYRSRAIPCAGTDFYKPLRREEWLAKLAGPGARVRAERLYSEVDHLAGLRRDARKALGVECLRHPASKILLRVPTLGIVRIAQLIARSAPSTASAASASSGLTAGWPSSPGRAVITSRAAPGSAARPSRR